MNEVQLLAISNEITRLNDRVTQINNRVLEINSIRDNLLVEKSDLVAELENVSVNITALQETTNV